AGTIHHHAGSAVHVVWNILPPRLRRFLFRVPETAVRTSGEDQSDSSTDPRASLVPPSSLRRTSTQLLASSVTWSRPPSCLARRDGSPTTQPPPPPPPLPPSPPSLPPLRSTFLPLPPPLTPSLPRSLKSRLLLLGSPPLSSLKQSLLVCVCVCSSL
ncbi:hypothetical protein GBAR_LOCUS30800, partial [Geodia barretti]